QELSKSYPQLRAYANHCTGMSMEKLITHIPQESALFERIEAGLKSTDEYKVFIKEFNLFNKLGTELPDRIRKRISKESMETSEKPTLSFVRDPLFLAVIGIFGGLLLVVFFGNFTGFFTQLLQPQHNSDFQRDTNQEIFNQLHSDINIVRQDDLNTPPTNTEKIQPPTEPQLTFNNFYEGYNQGFIIQNNTDSDINAKLSYTRILDGYYNPGYCSGNYAETKEVFITAHSNYSINIPGGQCSGHIDKNSIMYTLYQK
ncbi:MAG: hypothetical protein WCW44_04085, partial [archaeon]